VNIELTEKVTLCKPVQCGNGHQEARAFYNVQISWAVAFSGDCPAYVFTRQDTASNASDFVSDFDHFKYCDFSDKEIIFHQI